MAEENRLHADESGLLLLDRGRDAFRYRAALIGAAERSIDLQYYIWHDDRSGNYLADRVLQAAERGVRVRLLLDDFDAVGNDAVIPVLNAHPNIEVRVYNPFAQRRGLGRWLDLVVDLQRLNQRMHNKALVADGAAAIIGGRNIGDQYFALQEERAGRSLHRNADGQEIQLDRGGWNGRFRLRQSLFHLGLHQTGDGFLGEAHPPAP